MKELIGIIESRRDERDGYRNGRIKIRMVKKLSKARKVEQRSESQEQQSEWQNKDENDEKAINME